MTWGDLAWCALIFVPGIVMVGILFWAAYRPRRSRRRPGYVVIPLDTSRRPRKRGCASRGRSQ